MLIPLPCDLKRPLPAGRVRTAMCPSSVATQSSLGAGAICIHQAATAGREVVERHFTPRCLPLQAVKRTLAGNIPPCFQLPCKQFCALYLG